MHYTRSQRRKHTEVYNTEEMNFGKTNKYERKNNKFLIISFSLGLSLVKIQIKNYFFNDNLFYYEQ